MTKATKIASKKAAPKKRVLRRIRRPTTISVEYVLAHGKTLTELEQAVNEVHSRAKIGADSECFEGSDCYVRGDLQYLKGLFIQPLEVVTYEKRS